MNLVKVWNAQEAFKTLASLKKNPKLALDLLRFGKKVAAELALCEEHRQKLVYEVSGAEPGTPVVLEPGEKFDAYVTKFNEFLLGTSELPPGPVSFGVLIEALDVEKGNALSESDLALLEPFFPE